MVLVWSFKNRLFQRQQVESHVAIKTLMVYKIINASEKALVHCFQNVLFTVHVDDMLK